MQNNIWLYLAVMAGVTWLIRTTPLTLLRRPIRSRFIRSFLTYVPYVTLAVMTFPDILYATDSVWAGLLALVAGIALAWTGGNLPVVAGTASAVALIASFIFNH